MYPVHIPSTKGQKVNQAQLDNTYISLFQKQYSSVAEIKQ